MQTFNNTLPPYLCALEDSALGSVLPGEETNFPCCLDETNFPPISVFWTKQTSSRPSQIISAIQGLATGKISSNTPILSSKAESSPLGVESSHSGNTALVVGCLQMGSSVGLPSSLAGGCGWVVYVGLDRGVLQVRFASQEVVGHQVALPFDRDHSPLLEHVVELFQDVGRFFNNL